MPITSRDYPTASGQFEEATANPNEKRDVTPPASVAAILVHSEDSDEEILERAREALRGA